MMASRRPDRDPGATAGARPLILPDLGATVWPETVPEGLADELPGLYGSLFSTPAWFRLVDRPERPGCCLLETPRHVVLFTPRREPPGTVEVLNKAFPIAPSEARRLVQALFRALPWCRRVVLEVPFPPAALGLPHTPLHRAADLVIDLAGGAAAWEGRLGRRTRKNLRNLANRLRRDHPDLRVDLGPPGPRARLLFDQFLLWHLERCLARGVLSGYVTKPEQADQVAALLATCGEAQVVTVAGRPAAIELVFFVGEEATVFAGSFDPAFARYSLGFLSTAWAVRGAAARGARRCHLLWGTATYKTLLGARPEEYVRLAAYRSASDRLRHPADAARAARLVATRGREAYWDLRLRLAARLRGRAGRE